MDFETILLIFKQVFNFLVLIFIGYAVRRSKLVGEGAGRTLAVLLTWVFSPLYSIINMSQNVSIEKVSIYLSAIGWGTVFLAVFIGASIPLAKIFAKDKNEMGMFSYMFAFCNLGYFGYPFIENVFGDAMLVEFMFFCLPSNIAIYTYGYYILTRASNNNMQNLTKKEKLAQIMKKLISMPMIGMLVGLTVGLIPFDKSSQVFTDIIEVISPPASCMSPCAMLLAGIVLAKYSLKDLFSSIRSYLISIVRLLGIPLIAGVICLLLKLLGVSGEILLLAMCVSCFPAGMNVVVFPEAVGLDSSSGAKACFISYVLAIVCVPIVLALVLAFII